MKLTCYFDGACEPMNPGGHLGMGAYVVSEDSEIIFQTSRYRAPMNNNTNNVAEYGALWYLLDWLDKNLYHSHDIEVLGDSMLVVMQMKGAWRIKSGDYVKAAWACKEVKDRFKSISFAHIPRDQNAMADRLSKASLESRGIFARKR